MRAGLAELTWAEDCAELPAPQSAPSGSGSYHLLPTDGTNTTYAYDMIYLDAGVTLQLKQNDQLTLVANALIQIDGDLLMPDASTNEWNGTDPSPEITLVSGGTIVVHGVVGAGFRLRGPGRIRSIRC